MLVETLVLFILGLILGSFANVVIYRYPKGESVVFPGSRCPQCKTTLEKVDFEKVTMGNNLSGFMLSCPSCHCALSVEVDWMDHLAGKVAWRVKHELHQKDSGNAETPQDDV